MRSRMTRISANDANKELDPKRPWRSEFWKMANPQHKIWVLMMSSSLFWTAMVFLLAASFAFSIKWANVYIYSTLARRLLEMGLIVSVFFFGLGMLVLAFEISFYVRDFVVKRLLKNGTDKFV